MAIRAIWFADRRASSTPTRSIGGELTILLKAGVVCDVTRLFTDDGEMLTNPYLSGSRARANPGADLHVPMPGKVAKAAATGTLS